MLRCGPIGKGSFGRVYIALITNDHPLRPVALKKVHITNHAKHPPLLHEAAALLRLRAHRSIPEVYGWGSSQFFEYLSLQWLGPDLYWWFIRMGKPLTSRNLTAIVWQMLDVLEYVHSQGIIHCDVKPPNIMLGRGDNKAHVFLSDFGLSLPFDPNAPPSERATHARGSGFYMSLSNHRRRALSPHDDMESLAYTILELQMGCLPWDNCMSLAEVFVSKQRWTGEHWTAGAGCSKFFGEFLDSVRDRDRALDYARWKRDLCGDSTPAPPGAEAPYKYDPSDDDIPISRNTMTYNDSEPHKSLTTSNPELARLLKTPEAWPSLSGSEHGFHPFSTWSGPVTLEEVASFGDERELVLQELALIDRLPTCGESQSASDLPEMMRRFDDVLGVKNVFNNTGGDADGNNGEVGNAEEQVSDSGYAGSEGNGSDEDKVRVVPEIANEARDVENDFDDSAFRQFYDPEYDSEYRQHE